MTLKKKFAYILVNGLMANFEFRSFWAKKVNFFCHGALILPRTIPTHFWIFFTTNIKIKLAKVSLKSEGAQGMLVLLVASKIKMAATAKRAIGGRKYFGWLTYSMVGLIDISFEEIGDFQFGRLFVT